MSLERRLAYLRTTTFRFALMSAALFAAAAGLIVFYLYGATATALAGQVDRAIGSEIDDLVGAFRSGGPNSLNREIVRRSLGEDEFLYLFAYENGRRISRCSRTRRWCWPPRQPGSPTNAWRAGDPRWRSAARAA